MNNSLSTKRRRSVSLVLALAALALAMSGSTARAQTSTASYYFTLQGSTVPLTALSEPPNATFTLSVYVTSNYAANFFDTFIGYDRSTTATETATRTDNKIVLNGTKSSAITNLSDGTNGGPRLVASGNLEGGGQATTSGAFRPYGNDTAYFVGNPDDGSIDGTTFTATTPTRLFDISLKTTSTFTGTETVSIYSVTSGTDTGAAGTDFTTYLSNGTTFLRPTPSTYNLTVTALAAPEPTAVISLLLGACLLGLQLWRVRSRLRRSVRPGV